MRHAIALLAATITLAGASCTPRVEGPASPAPAAELRGAPALLQAQVRGATERFVEAYRATVLGEDDLEQLAATPLMSRFAYWLSVTNRSFPGEITAPTTVNGVGPATVVDAEGQILQVDLSAQVDVVAQPPEGEPLGFTVPLDGPVRFAAREPGAWRVIDFVRFGVPVSGAFVPLDLRFTRPGMRIILDSFGGVPNWSFFVGIAATGPQVLSLAESDVTLVDAGGGVVGRAVEVSVQLLEVAPGGRVDGTLSFEPMDDIAGVSLRIDVGGSGDPAPLEIPLRSLVAPEAVP
ncbi:hypothetical protein BH18ACT17_BH18ACT17_05230 [soil metagenome]